MENPFEFGFVRVAVASPALRVADVDFNVAALGAAMERAAGAGASLLLFPELSVTAYTCGDLFYQALLLERARAALRTLARATADARIAAVAGLPLLQDGKIFNCAAFLADGVIVGIVPKTFLPSTQEYYESRWFASSRVARFDFVEIGEQRVPFGTDLVFRSRNVPQCVVGIEICEDLWAINTPSSDKALAGATILLNPSASDDTLGKADYRRDLVAHQAGRCLAAYLYAGASANESTTDVVFAGHSLIAENGALLAETERFHFDTQLVTADVDVERLINERTKNTSFAQQVALQTYRACEFILPPPRGDVSPSPHGDVSPQRLYTTPYTLQRPLSRTPFVPDDPALRAKHCREIFALQATGLAKRLKHTGIKNVTLGLSGGLDSTLALLVTLKAFEILNLDRQNILALSMPGFGTTARTKSNAEQLADALEISFRTISIRDAALQHFRDIGQDENLHDVVYENAQARERTQILMDVANQIGGLVVGTGDLSELALGWATYNGDHMSMYHVNAGVPKTLVRYLVEWYADGEARDDTAAHTPRGLINRRDDVAHAAEKILRDIVATPITPELLPLCDNGALQQETETTIGPYVLHDFFLFYMVRHQFAPRKIFWLAQHAFANQYDAQTILKWLAIFYKRFFSQQFKRSAMPDGPKVGSVALSPRGDWRMPSDASAALWLQQVRELELALADGTPMTSTFTSR